MAEPIIQDLGTLEGNFSVATAVSANGSVIVGEGYLENGQIRAFRWTEAGAMQNLGTLGGTYSSATAVSADGSVIVGESYTADSSYAPYHAFRWTEANLMQDLGTLGGRRSSATAVSSDGSVIVGNANLANGDTHAFRWDEDTLMQDLGTLGGNSFATAVSADGNVIVGVSYLASNYLHAFRWTETNLMQDLGTLGGNYAFVAAISADGSVIVGDSHLAGGNTHAFRWTETNLMQDLGTLGGTTSAATAISVDGSVIVGDSVLTGGNTHAFRWTEANLMQDLGTLGGTVSFATAISADGSIIVGNSNLTGNNQHAFRWTEANLMQDLGTLGGATSAATAISADGNVIVGYAETASGQTHAALWKFSKPVDPETPSVIDVDNTIKTVASAANDTFTGLEMQRRGLDRLQKGCDITQAGKTCYSVMTDIDSFAGNTDILSRISVGHAFTDNFSAGISIAHSFWRDLPDSFERNNNNIGGGLYAKWKQDTADGNWYLRGAVSANRYKVTRTRTVLSYTEAGTGGTVINGWGASLELGRNHMLSDKDSFGYYGGLRYSDMNMDGYTEHNAAFPFTYSKTTSKQTTAYIGANYTKALSEKVKWSINGEVEQDIAHKDPSVIASADYIGALKFDSNFTHTRASLSSTLAYSVTNDVSISVTPYVAGTSTRDTAFGAMIGLSGKF